jgi:pilus assembly protein CpaB
MKSKAVVHLIIALVLALVAGFLTINWLKGQRQTQQIQAPVEKKVEVAVAARSLTKGTRLESGMLKLNPYAPSAVPSGAFLSLSELDGRALARDVSQFDAITQDKLYPKGVEGGGLVLAVEAGKRALTVKGNKVLGAAGLITPGSRVDVLMTVTLKVEGEDGGKEREYQVAKLILADAPVVATGSEMDVKLGKDGKEELSPVDTYTLLVTPEDAEKLALAETYGALSFALRKAGDAEIINTPGADMESTLSSYRSDAETGPEVEPAPVQKQTSMPGGEYTAETIRGTEKEQVTLEETEAAK